MTSEEDGRRVAVLYCSQKVLKPFTYLKTLPNCLFLHSFDLDSGGKLEVPYRRSSSVVMTEHLGFGPSRQLWFGPLKFLNPNKNVFVPKSNRTMT